MLVITTAMKQEADSVKRCLRGLRDISGEDYRAWTGHRNGTEVLTVQTGMGRENVINTFQSLLEAHEVSALVSIGFGGALTPDLRPGHVILCSTTLLHETESGPSRFLADEKLLQTASGCLKKERTGWNTGSGVTVPEVADRRVKEDLRMRFGAAVCEMEDAWLASLAREKGIPFLAVRIVMDVLRDDMDPYLDLGSLLDTRGRVKPGAALAAIVTRPGRVKALVSAFFAYRRARAGIARFVTLLLDNGLPL